MRMFDIVLTVIIELARIFITLEYFINNGVLLDNQ